MNFDFLKVYYSLFLNGTITTLQISLIAVILGLVGGVLVALLKTADNKLSRAFATTYIEIVRGTPLLLQLYLVYFAIPDIPMYVAGFVAMSINSTAYIAEIIRAGINSIDKGQMEAARSLGMSKKMAMKEIIIPQAFKNILPALGNEFIVLIKESAIVSVIGLHDLMFNAETVRGITYRPIEPLIVVAGIYFIITFTLSKFMGKLEGRLAESD